MKRTSRKKTVRKTTRKRKNGLGYFDRYGTREQKINTLKRIGNIITFKKKIPASKFGSRQIPVMEFYESADGKVKLIGTFYSTGLYSSIDKLIEAVDWKWMQENIWD
jgi:hypothetical protein